LNTSAKNSNAVVGTLKNSGVVMLKLTSSSNSAEIATRSPPRKLLVGTVAPEPGPPPGDDVTPSDI
jgi:hypothetical protein